MQSGNHNLLVGIGIVFGAFLCAGPSYGQTQATQPAASFVKGWSPTLEPRAGLGGYIAGEHGDPKTMTLSAMLDTQLYPLRVALPEYVDSFGQSAPLPAREILDYRAFIHLGAGWNLSETLSISATIPVLALQSGLNSSFLRTTLGTEQFGNVVVADPSLQIWSSFTDNIGLLARATLPIGAQTQLLGEPSVVIDALGLFAYKSGFGSVYANIGGRIRSTEARVSNAGIGSQLLYTIGLRSFTGQDRGTLRQAWFAEVNGARAFNGLTASVDDINGRWNTTEIRVGVRTRSEKQRTWSRYTSAGIGVGVFGRGYGQPLVRAFLGFNTSNDDPLRDRDEDGLVDALDTCPYEPEDLDRFMDRDGCPDPDNDQDGIIDDDDECLDEPETKNGFQDDDGCPDQVANDEDKDGFPDTEDRCRSEPEDFDGFADNDGCPEEDNDRDGLPDDSDVCPDAAEDRNGFQDDDGCPDGDKLVALDNGKLLIRQPVRFKRASAQLAPGAAKILEQLAWAVRDDPKGRRIRLQVFPENRSRAATRIRKQRLQVLIKQLTRYGLSKSKIVDVPAPFNAKERGNVSIGLVR